MDVCLPRLGLGYMAAYEDFAHVGVGCLIFSCGTIVHGFRMLPRTARETVPLAYEQTGVKKCVVDSGRGSTLRVCRPQV